VAVVAIAGLLLANQGSSNNNSSPQGGLYSSQGHG
jgi:hypothetical protein